MQNFIQKAKLEDIDNITGRSFFPITKRVINVGRSKKNDLVIRKNTVSTKHAIIEQKNDGHFLVDLNSSNNTFLNGNKLNPNTPYKLKDGDEIKFDVLPFVFNMKEVELPEPEPDFEETIFIDGGLTGEDESPEPKPDFEETIFIDGGLTGNIEPSKPEPDFEETIFIDGGLIDEVEPSAPATDFEETIFLEGDSLIDEVKKNEGQQDIIEGPNSKPFLEENEETFVRKESTDSTEIKKVGNYEVIKLLGKGGFGSVYKAKAPDGQIVAVKVLNLEVLENERAVRKFFHEAINLSKMDHPNICSFIDFFPYEGNYAIVMDFVQGTDLQDLLESQDGLLPFDTARKIAGQCLDALHYAHEKQVLHRDIKPENITLTIDGEVKIMDFGIAKLSSSESQETSLLMISPAYTAPERFDAKKIDTVDHRSDIYSLGLAFYELFTGKHPFKTDNPTDMILAHLSTVPEPPGQIVDLPRKISKAILKAVRKEPQDRFEDFAEFKMEMLGEATLRSSQTIGPIEFSGENCNGSADLLKSLSGVVKKHQGKARKITIGQIGTKINLIVETTGGNKILIKRDI